MYDRETILTALYEELKRWEALLSGLSEEQICAPQLPNNYSIKDELGHLRAWQQVSIARLEAAHNAGEPVLPDWLMALPPESHEHREDYNTRIHAIYSDMPGVQVQALWSAGFRRFLALAESIPELDMMDTQKYAWLNGYALYDVLKGSYEHHSEHYEPFIKQRIQE